MSSLPIPPLLRQAAGLGLVSAAEVEAGAVAVHPVPGSERVRAITVRERPVGYLRHGAGPAEEAREQAMLAGLLGLDLAPPVLSLNEDGLWLGVVRGTGLADQPARAADLVEVCQAWGGALARLHRARWPWSSRSRAPRPAMLAEDLSRTVPQAQLGSYAAMARLALQTDHALRQAATTVSARWIETYPTHGDLRPEHVRVETAPELRVRFVGFGCSGLGDPSWDVATAADILADLAPGWGIREELLTDFLLHGYRREDGPGRLSAAVQAVRALTSAWELGRRADAGEAPTDRARLASVLDRAHRHAARAAAVAWAA
ncbi:MAG: phosphotransferase [Actinomycetes bacterium]